VTSYFGTLKVLTQLVTSVLQAADTGEIAAESNQYAVSNLKSRAMPESLNRLFQAGGQLIFQQPWWSGADWYYLTDSAADSGWCELLVDEYLVLLSKIRQVNTVKSLLFLPRSIQRCSLQILHRTQGTNSRDGLIRLDPNLDREICCSYNPDIYLLLMTIKSRDSV